MMYTFDQICEIISQCSFGDWKIEVHMDGSRPYMQVHVVDGRDSETGAVLEWTGRKWMLSPFMCKNEIVATAFKAVMTAMEHEIRENFRYRGVAIFNPHLDPDALVEFVSNRANIQERPNVAFAE
jgi:hypothetical protein